MRHFALAIWMALAPAAFAAQQGSWSQDGKPLKIPATVANPSGANPLALTYTDPAGKKSIITLSPGAKVSITWDAKRAKPVVRVQQGRVDWDLNSVNAIDFSAPRQTITVSNVVGYVIVEDNGKIGGAGIVFIIGGTAGVIVGTYFGLQSEMPVSPHQ